MGGFIGQDVPRVDGPAKVTGSARYSGEITLPDLAYAQIVGARVASGRITSIEVTEAEHADGVAGILTHHNTPKVNQVPLVPSLLGGPAPGQTFFPMQDDVIHYAGQPVAVIVAATWEQAQYAATLIQVSYTETPSVTTINQGRADAYDAERIFGGLMAGRTARGDIDAGLAAAEVRIDAPFRFAANHHNPIEMLTTTAVWDGDQLTLYDSCQGIKAVQLTVAALLGISPSKVRVLARFIGGAFGCKAMVWPHVTLAALAAQHVRRPVRLTVTRGQMFSSCGHREEQEQHIWLGATRDGQLTAIRHRKISVTSPFDDWAEPAFGVASQLYASPAYEGVHRLVRGNTMTPTFTRGPGEALGVFTLECAMDELAADLGIDPVELRLRNLAGTEPGSGHPWSSYGLTECLQAGAERIGWASRNPRPRSERDGNWLIGTGMSAAAYPVAFFMRTQRARAHLYADGTAVVQTSTQEFGTGTPTVLTQVAADALGVDLRDVQVEFGDTSLPATGSPVGSNGAMMISAAVHNAGTAVRDQLIALAAADPQSPLHGADPAAVTVAGGRLMLSADPGTGESYAALMGRHRMTDAEAIGSWDPPPPDTPYGLLTSADTAVTGRVSSRPRPAGLHRQRLAAQPWLGVGGLLFGAAVFFALALGTGSPQTSLLILGPLSTFALPAVPMVAFWWNDWPGSRLTRPWTGLIDTLLVAAASVVLTIAGQAVVERADLRGVFEASPGPGVPTTFPATMALAGAAFTTMLQLSLVCERWPLGGIGRRRAGIGALALSWAIGTGAYFLFVNLDALPAAERAAAGLRNPGGPIAGPDFGSALNAVGIWQAVFFIALRGWPVNTINRRPHRLLAGNALVVGLGALTYLVLRNLAHWQPDAISAACGCTISATLIVAMLFDGWPTARLRPAPGRVLTLALTALVALALDRALAAYAGSVRWTRATPDEWLTTAALSFIGAGIILHVGIGLRWPFAHQTMKENP